jgi:hypothetical protein
MWVFAIKILNKLKFMQMMRSSISDYFRMCTDWPVVQSNQLLCINNIAIFIIEVIHLTCFDLYLFKMYKKQTSMSLKGTPSMLPNNMTTNKAKNLSYAVVHKSVVCVNTIVAAGSSPVQKQIACKGEGAAGNSTVMQVKIIP